MNFSLLLMEVLSDKVIRVASLEKSFEAGVVVVSVSS